MLLIRKISIGPDLLNAMHFSVGQKVMNGMYTVDNILVSNDESIQVWLQNKEQEVFLWKKINKYTPTTIEYNIDY